MMKATMLRVFWGLPALLILTHCGPELLFTEGGPETRHRFKVVFTDSAEQVAVLDESFTWACSGSMLRCYGQESDFRFSIFLADLRDTVKRDTLVFEREVEKGSRIGDGSPLFYNFNRGRLVYGFLPPLSSAMVWRVTNSLGAKLVEVSDLPRFRFDQIQDCLPSPDFHQLAVVAGGNRVFRLSLDNGVILDSVSWEPAVGDSGTIRKRLLWESDTSLIVQSYNGIGYRIRGDRVTDTLTATGCIGRRTSSDEVSPAGRKLYWENGIFFQADPQGENCLGYQP